MSIATDAAGTWLGEVSKKNGPWAGWCAVLCVAFYVFCLQPMKSERALLIQTLQGQVEKNNESIQTIAESTQEMVRLQREILTRQDDLLKVARRDE